MTLYWGLDLAIGFGLPVVVHLAHRAGALSARSVRLFWLGAALGLIWEVPIFLFSATSVCSPAICPPTIVWPDGLPAHWGLLLAAHTLWDGGLFLAGAGMLRWLGRPVLSKFRWRELALLLAWGQLSALLVEFSAISNDAWAYVEGHAWNPTWAHVGGLPLTVLPQIIWLVAPLAFTLLAPRVAPTKPS
jgi:hypothetical protein